MFFYFQRKLHKSRIYVDCASGQGKKQVPHNVRTPGRDLGTSQQGARRRRKRGHSGRTGDKILHGGIYMASKALIVFLN